MREWPELVGRTYLEVLTMFEDAVPLGIRTPEGNHLLNPEDTFTIHEGKHTVPGQALMKPACSKSKLPSSYMQAIRYIAESSSLALACGGHHCLCSIGWQGTWA